MEELVVEELVVLLELALGLVAVLRTLDLVEVEVVMLVLKDVLAVAG